MSNSIKQLLLCGFVLLLATYPIQAQTNITEIFLKQGFENISVKLNSDNKYYISYENNLYVWNVNELRAVIDIATEHLPAGSNVCIITLKNQQPVLATQFNTADWKDYKSGIISPKALEEKIYIENDAFEVQKNLKGEKVSNSNIGKFDIVVYPNFYIRNIKLSRTYDVYLGVSPAVEFSLWKGNLFTAQVQFPLINDNYGWHYDKVRPGFTTITQDFVLPKAWYIKLTAGNFNSFRWGFDGDISHIFGDGNWEAGMNVGSTGTSYFDGFSKWYWNNPADLSVLGRVKYYFDPLETEVQIKGGRFYSGKYGTRADLTRHFRSVTVGFFALLGDFDFNGGFHFSMPLNIPSKYKRRKVRIMAPRYFDWEYTYKPNSGPGEYETRPNENRSEYFLNKNFVKKQLLK